jgi:hypothetical protein
MAATASFSTILFLEEVSLSFPARLSVFGIVMTTILGIQNPTQASWTYTSVVTQSTITSSSGLSQVTFGSVSGGPETVGATLQLIPLSVIQATSTATSAETLTVATLIDTLTIYDGGQSGTITFNIIANAGPGGAAFRGFGITAAVNSGTYAVGIINGYSTAIVVNGDTFKATQFNYGLPKTNGANAMFSTDITSTPAAVPEPSSLVLVGMGGIAILAGRRFRSSSRSGLPAND